MEHGNIQSLDEMEHLLKEDILHKGGNITLSIGDIPKISHTRDIIGNCIQEWLPQWFKDNGLDLEPNKSTQTFPDFIAHFANRSEMVDIKCWNYEQSPGFNLEVENNHTYNANGIICHNCTNISIAGNRTGIKGEQSRMFFEVIRLLKERAENQKTLPAYFIMENVKNLLSSNEGRDFAEVIYQMDKVGYDAEWCVFDSAEVVPQHRERIYIVGHLRDQRTRGVFPIQKQSKGSPKSKIKIIANDSQTNFCSNDIVSDHGISKKIEATSYKHVPRVAIHQVGNFLKTNSFGGNPQIVVKACLTPDRPHKRQNGRRFKENNEAAFTVTVADRNGVLLDNGNTVAIRKLTPRECWRLQGFTDAQFDKAQKAGVSNSQLYKQAGNAVTVPVVEAIGKKLAENEAKNGV